MHASVIYLNTFPFIPFIPVNCPTSAKLGTREGEPSPQGLCKVAVATFTPPHCHSGASRSPEFAVNNDALGSRFRGNDGGLHRPWSSPVVVSAVIYNIHVAISVSAPASSASPDKVSLPVNAHENSYLHSMVTQAYAKTATLASGG